MSESKYIDLEFCLSTNNTQSGGATLQSGIALINPSINNPNLVQEAGAGAGAVTGPGAGAAPGPVTGPGTVAAPGPVTGPINIEENPIVPPINIEENPIVSEVVGGNSNKLMPLVYQL